MGRAPNLILAVLTGSPRPLDQGFLCYLPVDLPNSSIPTPAAVEAAPSIKYQVVESVKRPVTASVI